MEQLPIETTVYSMSAKPPPKRNRRAGKRILTLFRVGSIIIGDRRELCLVKNISAGGALVRVYSTLKAKQPLQIELKEGQPVPGHVSWAKGTEAGIEFILKGGRLVLKLSDNGKGFDAEQTFDGNGLQSMRQRAERLGGSLEVASLNGKGTRVTLETPIR